MDAIEFDTKVCVNKLFVLSFNFLAKFEKKMLNH